MVAEIRITGAEQFTKLARDLKAAGVEGKGLQRELRNAARVSTAPMVKAAKASALESLPKHGGLNEWVASSKISVTVPLSGSSGSRGGTGAGVIGVRIKAKKAGGRKGSHDLEAMDAGTFRHPVYGNPKKWVEQSIEPGWFTKPLNDMQPLVYAELKFAMDIIARRLAMGTF